MQVKTHKSFGFKFWPDRKSNNPFEGNIKKRKTNLGEETDKQNTLLNIKKKGTDGKNSKSNKMLEILSSEDFNTKETIPLDHNTIKKSFIQKKSNTEQKAKLVFGSQEEKLIGYTSFAPYCSLI